MKFNINYLSKTNNSKIFFENSLIKFIKRNLVIIELFFVMQIPNL